MLASRVLWILALTGLWTLAPGAREAAAAPDPSPADSAPAPQPAPPAAGPQQGGAPAQAPQSRPSARAERPRARRARPPSPPLRDPRAEEVLRAVLEASGGEEYLRSIQSLFIRSRLVQVEAGNSRETLVTEYWKAPGRYRRDFESEAGLRVMSYNGRYGWVDMGDGVSLVPKAQSSNIEDQARDMNEPLSHLDAGNSLAYEGEQDLDGRKVDVILVTRSSGKLKRLFIDRETRQVLQKEVAFLSEPDKPRSRRRLSEYRQIERIWVPHLDQELLAESPARMELLNYIPNQSIDDRVFDSPVPPFEETLQPSRSSSPP